MKAPLPVKHPRAIRWFHWIHFPLIALMIWSGLLIYWANDVYRFGFGNWTVFHFFPDSFYQALRIDHRLAEGMALHFFGMWLFAINGILYFAYLIRSGEWRELVPSRHSFRDAVLVALYDLRLRKKLPPQGKFNGAQRIVYTGVILMGGAALATGLAIYKPVQAGGLASGFGGYDNARLLHFWLMIGFVLFFAVHVIQVARAGWENFRSMVTGFEVPRKLPADERRLASLATRRSFVTGALSFGAALLGWRWLRTRAPEQGAPWPLRRVLEVNGDLWRDWFRPERLSQPYPPPPAGKRPRFNGDLGLTTPIDESAWRLKVAASTPGRDEDEDEDDEDGSAPPAAAQELSLTLADLKWMPRTEVSTELRCIEGWSDVNSYAGVRFSDFLERLHLGTRSGRARDFYRYVALETPDRGYYVSIDMESMLHPQTVLAYEMNGAPLSPMNGAPLRLMIPVKYGIKSIKRIGRIWFSDTRPPDYWAERGYDWFAGL